jgi:uncharacterized protein (TIGR03435 family)
LRLQYERLKILTTAALATVLTGLTAATHAQSLTPPGSGQVEFEAASVKVAPPSGFAFSFSADVGSGGPGTADPGLFRCASCTLAALIGKAFQLQHYQFPGRSSLPNTAFQITARVPAGTTPEAFRVMLQNLLKERFGLTYHFDNKALRGYSLTIAKGGARLQRSAGVERDGAGRDHDSGRGGSHSHTGVINFGGQARYQALDRSIADLVQVLSNELAGPVEDRTGLQGRFDINLSWSSSNDGGHGPSGGGGPGGGPAGGHDHGGAYAGGAGASGSGDNSAPALLDAVQSQLGLKLVAGERSAARIFIVDHVEKLPVPN